MGEPSSRRVKQAQRMTLRLKVVLITGGMVIGLLLAIYIASSTILLRSHARLESRETTRNMERVLAALGESVHKLSILVSDWSPWNDLYSFAEDRNAAFIESNLMDSTFSNSDLNFILVLDTAGKQVYGKGFDLENDVEAPIPAEFMEFLSTHRDLWLFPDIEDKIEGVIALPSGLLLVATRPILTSDHDGPSHGTLTMGRWLSEPLVEQISDLTQLSVSIARIDDATMPPDFKGALEAMSAEAPVCVSTPDADTVNGYGAITDLAADRVAIVRVTGTREIHRRGVAGTKFLLASLAGAGLLFGMVSLLLFEGLVLRPVGVLNADVSRIGAGGDFSARVTVHGQDELSQLAKAINAKLEELDKANRATAEANARAERANCSKSEFLANMSHEIRTPMTAILGYAELLAESCGQSSDADAPVWAAQIQTVRRNGKHLLEIINDILDLSKIEAQKLDSECIPCALPVLLSEIANLMVVRAQEKHLPFELEYASPIPESIHTDPTRLRQILINLIGNAIKFTDSGAVRLVVRLEENASAGPGQGTRPQIRFDVIDTGVGLTAEHMGRLFQPFSQADSSTTRRFGGTGLGLAISSRLAGLLGGGITVESQVNVGSTFHLTIPTGPMASVALCHQSPCGRDLICPTGPHAADAPALLDCRVLLAEDGPDNQRLIVYFLEKVGAAVTVAENGQLAVERIRAANLTGGNIVPPFDIVLMDMQMPVLDGYEATRILRKEGFTGPIIALTAHAMAKDREKCLAAGCDEYTSKPINRNKLISVVADALRRVRGSTGETACYAPDETGPANNA